MLHWLLAQAAVPDASTSAGLRGASQHRQVQEVGSEGTNKDARLAGK